MMTAAIVQLQKKEEAKFICSACGADRGCQCDAPAVEKLARKQEQDRQRAKAYRERKGEENQHPRHVTDGDRMPERRPPQEVTVEDELEPDEYRSSFLLRAADAVVFAVYSGPIDAEVIEAARRVASTWLEFVQTLEGKNG